MSDKVEKVPTADGDVPSNTIVADVTEASLENEGAIKLNKTAETIETESEILRQRPHWHRFIGIGFSIISSILYSLAIALSRKVHNYDPFTVSFWRFQAMTYPSIVWLIFESVYLKSDPWSSIRPLNSKESWKTLSFLLLRSLAGAPAMIFIFFAEQRIGAGNATAIGFSHPVFVSILAWLILGESFGFVIVAAVIINIIGLFVMARPNWIFGGPKDYEFESGVLFALGTCVSMTIVFLTLRLLKTTNPLVISVAYGGIASLVSITVLAARGLITQVPRNQRDWLFACIIGSTAFLGQVCMSLSLRFEEAAICALLRCFDSIFAYLWAYIFYRQVPDPISIIGCAVLLLGIMVISTRKIVEGLSKENPWKKRLFFLLK